MKNVLFLFVLMFSLLNVQGQFLCVTYSDDMGDLNCDFEVCVIFSSHCECQDDLPVATMDCATLTIGQTHCFTIPLLPCGAMQVYGCPMQVSVTPLCGGESVTFDYKLYASGHGTLASGESYRYSVESDGTIKITRDVIVGI